MKRTSVSLVLPLTVLALFAPVARSSDSLTFFNNWFVTGDYAVAGVGLRGTGVNGWASGKINMTGVPSTAQPIAAFLYWSTWEPSSPPAASIGYFNGNQIQGAVLGNPQSPNPGCSNSGGTSGFGFVYRADVLRYLPVNSSNIAQANGSQTVKLPDAGTNVKGTGINTEGASLVVIYKIIVPGLPTLAPLRAVVIYNGAFTLDKQSASMTQTVAGFYQAAAFDAARFTGIAGNGQPGFSSPLSVNGQNVSLEPFVGAQGPRWDNPSFNINLPTNAASFSAMATAGNSETCVTWAGIVASTNVQDSDNDGLLDAWETQGLHRNTQVFPATFGNCAQYPADPCVNLPAMGANPNKRDVFIQIDWMHGTGTGTGGIDGHGTHDHMPQLSALSSVAAVFTTNGINLHFDVGANYQGNQALCGNGPCSFIIPAAYGSGGSDIPESTLLCQSTAAHACDYNQPYPVLSFEYGFASVRDGNQLLGIPAHFAQSRKDIFHYSLFAHALAGPFNAQGQPINPFTLQPTNTPLSYSGIAQKPGGGFMVTLGLWPSDTPAYDQVGSAQVQAGTLMHELGHNLSLGHAGLADQPNCMANYPSVMNYMYQAVGLTDSSGNEHVDYSYGVLLPMNEDLLNASFPMALLPGLQRYKVRYFGPLGSNQTSTQAAAVHCTGTPLAAGAPAEVQNQSPKVSTPDWSDGTVPIGHMLPPLDLNYDGTLGQTFLDQPDWLALNLQQIGSGYSFGGLSVGSTATAPGAYATDGGAFATDAGALATDAGAFATDGGAFATDAGAFATDGGAFATDGGALATDGGAFATDAGELDEVTASGSNPPTPTNLTVTPTASSLVLNWVPPQFGTIVSYNIYRCAGVGCTPKAPAYKNVPGGTGAPTFSDTVNDLSDAGTTCPAAMTCYNTYYTYEVTALTQAPSSPVVEGPFSSPSVLAAGVTSPSCSASGGCEVTQLFIASTVGGASSASVVYGTAIPAAGYAVYGDIASSLTSAVSCTYSPANPRSVGTYYVVCGPTPTQTSPTDQITYLAGNGTYLSHTQGVLTITARPITVTAAASNKVYDGTVNAGTTPPAIPSITTGSLAYNDNPNFIETYDNQYVGNTHILTPSGAVNDGIGGNNYMVTFANAQNGVIRTRPLTATLTAQNKAYDGTNTEPNPNMTCSLANAIAGDKVTCAASAGTFNSTQVAAASTVSATATLAGTAASNYTLGAAATTMNSTPVSAPASITTLPLAATLTSAPSKTYDGTTTETNPMSCSVATVISPDVVTCAASNGNFDTSQVATASKVTATATISGTAVSNYTLGAGGTTVSVPSTSVSAASSITTRQVTTTLTAQSKPYDGTTVEPSNKMNCSLNNAVQADVQSNNVICSASNGTFNSSQVTSATTVSATAMLGGPAATNYTFGANATTVASIGVMATPVSITPAPLAITASSTSIAYGSPVQIMPMFNALVNNETSSVLGANFGCGTTYAPGNPVGNYGTSCMGAVDSNYSISYVGGVAMVGPALLIVAATGVNKSFDGTTNATVTLLDNRLFAADTFTDAYTSASFVGIGPGQGITVNVSGISISGPGATNYTLTSTTAMTTANISDSVDLSALSLNGVNYGSGQAALPTWNGSMLQLTNNTSETVSAWLPTAIPISSAFTTTFQFQITPAASGPNSIGDGFAFVIQGAPTRNQTLGSTGQGAYIGYYGIPNSIAIEFDTYFNSDYGDPAPTGNSDAHIAIQSLGASPNTSNHGTPSANFGGPTLNNFADGLPHTAKITYDGAMRIAVYVDGVHVVTGTLPSGLGTFLGLSGGTAYVGFTGATGAAQEADVLGSTWTWDYTPNQ